MPKSQFERKIISCTHTVKERIIYIHIYICYVTVSRLVRHTAWAGALCGENSGDYNFCATHKLIQHLLTRDGGFERKFLVLKVATIIRSLFSCCTNARPCYAFFLI
jgi:hypothetical protein